MKKIIENIVFFLLKSLAYLVSSAVIFIILYIFIKGIGKLNWAFLSEMPKNGMMEGGILPAIVGTVMLVFGVIMIAFPIGILSGIYMNEYAKENLWKRFIRLMTNNLAGIPSVVFGLFGLALFVVGLNMGVSAWSGSFTLALMILPVIIRTTEESLKSIPLEMRTSSYALGASKWYTIRKVIVPAAFPNIITGMIIAIGRVAGETAPIIFTAAAFYLPSLTYDFSSPVMALPYHLFVISTSGTDLEKSRAIAFGTALVLLLMILILNLLAGYIKNKLAKESKN